MMFAKIIKVLISIIVITLIIVIVVAVIFLNTSPQFGDQPTKEQLTQYAAAENFIDGKFQNQLPSDMEVNYGKWLSKILEKDPTRQPGKKLVPQKIDSVAIASLAVDSTRMTWFGHSAFLLEMSGKKILIDPMLGVSPSPISMLGTKRYSDELPISIRDLPRIDAVIISHDHYDHLDYESICLLKDKTDQFFVPLGVESHLIKWGVTTDKIKALKWGDDSSLDAIKLICVPARHFSGRGLFDRYQTLWCGWVIQNEKDNILFTGDSGYGAHFVEIGKQYGPFDLALTECGQYNEDWKFIHMMPEETAQVAVDVSAKLLMPIHWGAFTLAFHSWTDPVERVCAKAEELGVSVITPQIGEPFGLYPQESQWRSPWWRAYQ